MVVAEVCSTMKYPKCSQCRGDLTVWFDEEAIANWKADKTRKPGGQRVYSDMAIETKVVTTRGETLYRFAYWMRERDLKKVEAPLQKIVESFRPEGPGGGERR